MAVAAPAAAAAAATAVAAAAAATAAAAAVAVAVAAQQRRQRRQRQRQQEQQQLALAAVAAAAFAAAGLRRLLALRRCCLLQPCVHGALVRCALSGWLAVLLFRRRCLRESRAAGTRVARLNRNARRASGIRIRRRRHFLPLLFSCCYCCCCRCCRCRRGCSRRTRCTTTTASSLWSRRSPCRTSAGVGGGRQGAGVRRGGGVRQLAVAAPAAAAAAAATAVAAAAAATAAAAAVAAAVAAQQRRQRRQRQRQQEQQQLALAAVAAAAFAALAFVGYLLFAVAAFYSPAFTVPWCAAPSVAGWLCCCFAAAAFENPAPQVRASRVCTETRDARRASAAAAEGDECETSDALLGEADALQGQTERSERGVW